MANTRKRKQEVSTLINDNPLDTLDYCDAVLSYVQGNENTEDREDEYRFGEHLVLQCVRDALRSVYRQLLTEGREPRAKKPRLVVSNPPPAA